MYIIIVGKIYQCRTLQRRMPNSPFLWTIDDFLRTSSKFDGGEMLAHSNVVSYFTSFWHIYLPLNLIW